MKDLIEAAKAVIYDWDKYQNVHHESVAMLSAAVERAEKPPAGFEEWWDKYADLKYKFVPIGQLRQLWQAAQQAERERIRAIIRDVTGGFGNCDRLMERIDAATE